MSVVIHDFSIAIFRSADKAAIERVTKELFINKLGFAKQEFEKIFANKSAFAKEGELWKLNGVSSENVILKMRSGKLIELFEEMGIKEAKSIDWIKNKQMYLRETVMKDCPDLYYTKLEEQLGKQFHNFRETVTKLDRDVKELKNMSLESQKKVINNAGKAGWLKKSIFAGGVIVTAAVLAEVVRISVKMKGCYFNQMSNGKVKKYKIERRSFQKGTPHNIESYEDSHEFKTKNLPWNLNIKIRYALKNPDKHPNFNKNFKDVKLIDAEIKKCIKNNLDKLQNYFEQNSVKIEDPFELLLENEQLNCIACSHYAPENSIGYVPLTGLATNESMSCLDDVTIYDAFKNFGEDVMKTLIQDFADWTGLSGMWSKIGQFLLVVIIIAVVGQVLVTKFTGSNLHEQLIEEDIDVEMKPSKVKM